MSFLLVVLLAVHVCARDYLSNELPIEKRIFGGENAGEHEFPTEVYLYTAGQLGIVNCGGTILNEWFILTAAHCLEDSVPWMLVGAGSANISAGTIFKVEKIIIHEKYGDENDIGLIKLAKPLVLDGVTMKAAVLPEQDEDPTSTKATVIGSGVMDVHAKEPTVLQKISTQLTECSLGRLYSARQYLCISQGIQKGACHGDSGSPLIVDGKVVGVLHGPLTTICFKHIISVAYTRVSVYRSWIDFKMRTE